MSGVLPEQIWPSSLPRRVRMFLRERNTTVDQELDEELKELKMRASAMYILHSLIIFLVFSLSVLLPVNL